MRCSPARTPKWDFRSRTHRNPKPQLIISVTSAEVIMHRIHPLLPPAALIVFLLACGPVSARQASQEDLAVSPTSIEAPVLKVCLRLEDDSPFGGIMHVR